MIDHKAQTHPDESSSIFGAIVIGLIHVLPIIGILLLGWSPALILLIYLVENVVTIHVWKQSIVQHRIATRKRGHYGIAGTDLASYGRRFFKNALGVTMVHAIIVVPLFLISPDVTDFSNEPHWSLLIISCCAIATWFDSKKRARHIEERPFYWLDKNIKMVWWDINTMHFGIMVGSIWLLVFDGAESSVALAVVAYRALISYRQHRPVEGLETRRPSRWEIGISNPSENMIRQWRESMLAEVSRREEIVPHPQSNKRFKSNAVDHRAD